jgi:hypothetical protein
MFPISLPQFYNNTRLCSTFHDPIDDNSGVYMGLFLLNCLLVSCSAFLRANEYDALRVQLMANKEPGQTSFEAT